MMFVMLNYMAQRHSIMTEDLLGGYAYPLSEFQTFSHHSFRSLSHCCWNVNTSHVIGRHFISLHVVVSMSCHMPEFYPNRALGLLIVN